MKIAMIQSNPLTCALGSNMEALVQAVKKAAALGADLCVAPEMALCGHNAGDLMLRSGFAERCRNVLNAAATRLAQNSDLPPLLLGAPVANPVPQGKNLQSCAVLAYGGRITVIGRKVLLPSDGIHDDTRYFEPGVACGVLNLKGWRMAVTIGEDAWNDRTFWQGRRKFDSDPVADFIAAAGADALINLTALPYEQELPALHQNMLSHLAAHYHMPVMAVNLVGGDDSLVYYGGSLGFSGSGALITRLPMFREALGLVDLVNNGKNADFAGIAPDLEQEDELWQAIELGTKDFVRKCGFSKVVLGLSGGVDSALVAAVAARAFGPENVTGLLMPSPYSSAGSIEDSLELAEALGIATHVLPVTPILKAYEESFEAEFPGGLAGTAEENIQSRIRGSLLMAYANRFGAFLLATGNKSEAAVGYSTLYGDMAGGIGPIGDLYKHQVYALCRWHNARHPGAIPEAILDKAPSAELKPGQKDSDSLPAYEILDPLLRDILENGLGFESIVAKGHDPDIVREVFSLLRRAEFKRHQAAPALHLSKRSFGLGWRIPIASA